MKPANESFREDALQIIKSLHSEGLSRKEIVSVLVDDHGVPQSSAYRFYSAFTAGLDDPWDASPINTLRSKALQSMEILLEQAEDKGDHEKVLEICSIILKHSKRS